MGSASTLGVSGAPAGSGPGARPGPGYWLPPPSVMGPASPAPLAAGVTTKRWDMVARAPAPAARFPGASRAARLGLGGQGRGRGRGGASGGGRACPWDPAASSTEGPRRAREGEPAGTTRRAVGVSHWGMGHIPSVRQEASLSRPECPFRRAGSWGPRSKTLETPLPQPRQPGSVPGPGTPCQRMLETSLVWDSDHPQRQNGSQGPVTRRQVPEFQGVSEGSGLLDHGVWAIRTLCRACSHSPDSGLLTVRCSAVGPRGQAAGLRLLPDGGAVGKEWVRPGGPGTTRQTGNVAKN